MKYTCDCRQSRKGKHYNKEKQGREPMKVTVTKDGQCVYCNHYALAVSRTNKYTTTNFYGDPMGDKYEISTRNRIG